MMYIFRRFIHVFLELINKMACVVFTLNSLPFDNTIVLLLQHVFRTSYIYTSLFEKLIAMNGTMCLIKISYKRMNGRKIDKLIYSSICIGHRKVASHFD